MRDKRLEEIVRLEGTTIHQRINIKSWVNTYTGFKMHSYKSNYFPRRALSFTYYNHFLTYINYDCKKERIALNPNGKQPLLFGLNVRENGLQKIYY